MLTPKQVEYFKNKMLGTRVCKNKFCQKTFDINIYKMRKVYCSDRCKFPTELLQIRGRKKKK